MLLSHNTNTSGFKYTGDTPLFRYEPLINFWLRFFDTRREKQFLKVFRNHTILSTPTTFNTSQGPISIFQHHGGTTTSQHHGRTSTESFSKSSKFSAHLFWVWRYPHPSPFPVRVFIMTILTVIFFARERKLYPMLCPWTLNPNSSKPKRTEW